MQEIACPWCESALALVIARADEQQCPECLTTWLCEESELDLPLAA